ncbi:MAG: GNAT family N-acetyltransferase [Sulfuricurvum sp.]|nr:GNAT family N-acetyltransferase [Sulfuricurvum sp.]
MFSASTEMERTAILQQRYDIFVEEFNYLAPREDGKHIEYDEYDKYSLLFGVWEEESLIASCRLVLPNPILGLPTLKVMVIDAGKLESTQPTAEISRILVASKHRIFKKTIKILQIMQKEINKIASEYNIVQLIGSVEASFLRLLNCAKLPYQAIGPLQHHIGPDRYPIVLKLQDNITSIKEES